MNEQPKPDLLRREERRLLELLSNLRQGTLHLARLMIQKVHARDVQVDNSILVDTIDENTPATGVTIDSVLLKDGVVAIGDVAFDDATSDPVAVGDAAADGTEDSVARKDHGHATGGTAGGDLGGTYPNPTVDDGADSTAIHDNVAGEIVAITEKTTPVANDEVVVEDSAASNVKKSLKIGNIDHDTLSAGTIASHDTSATGAQLDTLTDTSDADALHDHATLITAAEAISAVEGEATLDLTGDVTIAAAKSMVVDTISEKTGAAGVTIDGLLVKDEYLELDVIAAPGAPAASKARAYVKDYSAQSGMFYIDEAGNEFWLADSVFRNMPLSSVVTQWTIATGGTGAVVLRNWRMDTSTGAGAGAARSSESISNLGITQGAAENIINWNRRILIKVRFSVTAGGAGSISRLSLGRQRTDGTGDLDDKAVGIKITTLALAGQVHTGAALTTTGTLATLVLNQVYDLLIISRGDGTVEWFLDEASIGTSAGGPVGAGANAHTAFRVESVATGAFPHECHVFRYGYADLVA